MKNIFILIASFFLNKSNLNAQYADLGTGNLKNYIWWFDWNGFTIKNGATKKFNTADGLEVTISFSDVQGNTFKPSPMNTWYGSVLHFLYNFSNANVKPALYSVYSTKNSTFNITVAATRHGVPVSFKFIAADAEASAENEVTSLKTDGGNWVCVDFFRNSKQTTNPFSGCNTKNAELTDTWGGGSTGLGQNPVIATEAPASGKLSVECDFSRKSIEGQMGIAFGIFSPIDCGDLPQSYGNAQHQLGFTSNNACNYKAPLPSLAQAQSLKLGALPGDADANQSADDNTNGADEDGIAKLPMYDGSGTYSISVTHTNTSGRDAFLTAWLDYNQDGVFTANEAVTKTIPINANSTAITWTGIPLLLPSALVKGLSVRLRLSSNLSEIQTPSGYAANGEAEDYFLPITCPPSKEIAATAYTLKKGDSLMIKAKEDDAKYFWNNKLTSQTFFVKKAGIYFARIEKNGCTVQSDTVTIKAEIEKLASDYTKRNNELIKIIEVADTAEFILNFLDYRQEDGDIISVFVNDNPVLKEQLLSKTPLKVPVKLSRKTPVVEVKVVAENLGTIPPNTAMMMTTVNGKKYEAQIVSSGQKNAIIRFKLK